MNQITIPPEFLKNSRLISLKISAVELHKVSSTTFALINQKTEELMIGFASSALARLIDDNNLMIYEVSMITQKVKIGLQPDEKYVLLLKLGNDATISIDEDDIIHICNRQRNENAETAKYVSPISRWNAASDGHFSQILLTERMAILIEELSKTNQELQLLHILWKDYATSNILSGESLIRIAGEIMVFQATLLGDSLVLFDFA